MTESRCALESLARDEPLLGTASQVSSYLLIEHNGPWPCDALATKDLSEELRTHLSSYDGTVLLIRRPDRPTGSVHAFEARPGRLTGLVVASHDALIDADLTSWPLIEQPLYLVCTHGKRDACCAKFGRPVVEALASAHPAETWEVSHIGGHRFAGNLLVLPKGDVFGRVSPAAAVDVVSGSLPGLLRGNCWLSAPDQVAQVTGRTPVQRDLDPGRHSCRDALPSPISAWIVDPNS